jgi:hypothetical protein
MTPALTARRGVDGLYGVGAADDPPDFHVLFRKGTNALRAFSQSRVIAGTAGPKRVRSPGSPWKLTPRRTGSGLPHRALTRSSATGRSSRIAKFQGAGIRVREGAAATQEAG